MGERDDAAITREVADGCPIGAFETGLELGLIESIGPGIELKTDEGAIALQVEYQDSLLLEAEDGAKTKTAAARACAVEEAVIGLDQRTVRISPVSVGPEIVEHDITFAVSIDLEEAAGLVAASEKSRPIQRAILALQELGRRKLESIDTVQIRERGSVRIDLKY